MLKLHRSERADLLVEALGDVLLTPLADPLTPEIVAVPTRGVERWLSQRLSHRLGTSEGGAGDGICAHIDFPFPGSLVGQAISASCGVDPDTDPWRPERSVWTLIDLIDRHAEDPDLAPLTAHLRAATPADRRGEPQPVRRFATARHVADLFDHYSVHRPEMVLEWATAESTRVDSGGGDDADPTAAWQSHLWRLLRSALALPSPAERFADTAERLMGEPEVIDLPERVSLFGLTRLPTSHIQVLAAMAEHRDVHLWLLHPSGSLWDRVMAAEPATHVRLPRADDPTVRLATHPLLRSWGRDGREMQLVLASRGVGGGDHIPVPGTGTATALLHLIQDGIRTDTSPPGRPRQGQEDERVSLDPDDRSLQIHACHGRSRQVEVMRDSILHLLDADATLEPRDVIVMCPDIETFAPLIHAAFDPDDGEHVGESTDRTAGTGLPHLRTRLADRSVLQTNPLLAVAAQVLTLAGARVTASEVMDLATRPAVARRFRFDADDLAVMQRWVAETGIRWGLDTEHRKPWALDRVADGTWESGLDRLLLGVTMAEEGGRIFAGTLPYDDVPSSEVELAGKLAELVRRLGSTVDRLQGPHPVAEWTAALLEGTESLAAASFDDAWQHEQLQRVLSEAASEAGRETASLSLGEARDLLDSRLQGRPTRANFRTGDLTICTMVPMRSVPHRVVGLLGLDDGAFPRHPERDGDDLLLTEPCVGDRDPRSEDRQLLLDALLAARENLIITYSGRDERTNRVRPPAVPVAELLDAIDATARPADGRPARTEVVTHHPLQPYDRRLFTPGVLRPRAPWSYDRVQLAGSRAAANQTTAGAGYAVPLAPLQEPVLQLDDLVRFVEHPVRAFLRRRLGLYLSDRSDELIDDLPIDLDALEKWGVGDRLLQARLAGTDPERAAIAERARGLLPPGNLADSILEQVGADVEKLAAGITALGFEPGPADSLDIHLDLPDGRSLIGTVPNLRGNTVVVCTYSRLAPKHRLAAWVRFLALSAARPDLGVTFVTIGRGANFRQPPQASRYKPLEQDGQVVELLQQITDLYDRGMREPLPLACATSGAWAAARHRGSSDDDTFRDADSVWRDDKFPGEESDIEHRYAWDGRVSLTRLMQDERRADESGAGWADDESSRFAVLALRLWTPILDHERLGDT